MCYLCYLLAIWQESDVIFTNIVNIILLVIEQYYLPAIDREYCNNTVVNQIETENTVYISYKVL